MCAFFTTTAQEVATDDFSPAVTNKRGVLLLPGYGDFALGFDAMPFLNWFGNRNSDFDAFNGVNHSIYGKYFLGDDRAIRGRLTINMSNTSRVAAVRNDFEFTNNPLNALATALDAMNTSSFNIDLGAGYELRRGKGRVQGFYGGEVILGFGSGTKQTMEYGNPMTEVNQNPTHTIFVPTGSSDPPPPGRVTEVNNGSKITAGLGGFVGVEYFFAPQISIGGEFCLALRYTFTGQTERTIESWNAAANNVQTQTSRSGQWDASDIAFGTAPNFGGRLFLMFHF